jgi:hypothetical protein
VIRQFHLLPTATKALDPSKIGSLVTWSVTILDQSSGAVTRALQPCLGCPTADQGVRSLWPLSLRKSAVDDGSAKSPNSGGAISEGS